MTINVQQKGHYEKTQKERAAEKERSEQKVLLKNGR